MKEEIKEICPKCGGKLVPLELTDEQVKIVLEGIKSGELKIKENENK